MASTKKFRFQNTSALLTYKTHLDKKAYLEWFEKQAKQTPVFIRLAHETGSHDEGEPDYDHTHVVFKCKSRIDTTSQRFFDFNAIHPHIKVLKTNKSIDDAKKYIAKEDKDNEDLLVSDTSNFIEGVWSKNTIQEALLDFVKKPSDVAGIIQLYGLKKNPTQIHEEDIPRHAWQIALMKETEKPPTKKQRRQIIWVVDRVGNTGKSQLAKYMIMSDPKKWFVCKDLGTSRDSSTIIQFAIAKGWEGHGVIIDLPRSAENHDRMYSYIEEIKDGFVTSQKYQGCTSTFNKPHLIVFANWEPNYTRLSYDRWDMRRLEVKGKTITMESFIPTILKKKRLEYHAFDYQSQPDEDHLHGYICKELMDDLIGEEMLNEHDPGCVDEIEATDSEVDDTPDDTPEDVYDIDFDDLLVSDDLE
ncbi:replication-associated protein [Fire ant associated circular virus 1]|uniref:Replication-associated protein n=1 Tax=Fire ant associated circular virus 1 TaxID=2293280 RepID=A0A346BPB0_9VIRU|nr:replication-associated protein [Fire ant associated circular virus 1]AXL65907.1 replication-associated protein [Fire ant associated circular virus 1]